MRGQYNDRISINNVGKLFTRVDKNGLTHAISDVSFEAKEKEFVSIVGPSGCGKSTMLRLIAGLIGPSFGEITLDGEKIAETKSNRGMVFQKPTLFPWLTVKANVAFSGDLAQKTDDEMVEKLLKK